MRTGEDNQGKGKRDRRDRTKGEAEQERTECGERENEIMAQSANNMNNKFNYGTGIIHTSTVKNLTTLYYNIITMTFSKEWALLQTA